MPRKTADRSLPDPAAEPTLTVPRVAAILGCSERSIRTLTASGAIPVVRVGHLVRVPTAEFLAQYRLAPAAVTA